jgi:N-acetylglucosaminyl-diphospho-decaprenol L-rhamnosyltransferase
MVKFEPLLIVKVCAQAVDFFGIFAMEKIDVDKNIAADISISVVSHLQIKLIAKLLADINSYCNASKVEVILTLNLDEEIPFNSDDFPFTVKVIRNTNPLGFGANHNQAFLQSTGRYYCVVNPDIRLNGDPFKQLIACLSNASVGVVAPIVLGANGEVEDSARRFPSPFKILCKVFGGCKDGDYLIADKPFYPDWVGGMFMLFPRGVYEQLGGFDQRYFLYYEDVDICARLRLLGYEVLLCTDVNVIHEAQRSSHRNLKYLRWHLTSMMRFFLSSAYWKLNFKKLNPKG